MSGPRGRARPGENRLLGVLPRESRERLVAESQRISLQSQQVLVHIGQRLEHVYFPTTAVISLLVVMADGSSVDAATVGFEGMAGTQAALDEGASPHEMNVQVPGDALRMEAGAFERFLPEDAALREVVLRFAQVLFIQSTRDTACNRLHGLEERLARWMLHLHDWASGDELFLTQEIIAQMLGVRRPSVTLAAGALAGAGIISYRRGRVMVLDRDALEDAACEDYAAVRSAYEQLLPLPR